MQRQEEEDIVWANEEPYERSQPLCCSKRCVVLVLVSICIFVFLVLQLTIIAMIALMRNELQDQTR